MEGAEGKESQMEVYNYCKEKASPVVQCTVRVVLDGER